MQTSFLIGVFIVGLLSISNCSAKKTIAVVGGGPAGLMAAEVMANAGHQVSLYDAMPSVGRKFLLAGVGGMNITHAEPRHDFLSRYSDNKLLINAVTRFDPEALRDWVHGLGIQTFVGTSGRVFPTDMKAAPLLRAWLHRLRELGVKIYPRHRWLGWGPDPTFNGKNPLIFASTEHSSTTPKTVFADATLLALGGASWQRLGSDGAWVTLLRNRGVEVKDLLPSNCGFDIRWSDVMRNQFAGAPLQSIGLSCTDPQGNVRRILSEAVISAYGIEGTGVYALSSYLRKQLVQQGVAYLYVDLLPDWPLEKVSLRLNKPRDKSSLSNFLRKQLHLSPVKVALLRECATKSTFENPALLAQAVKNVPLTLNATRPIDEAISCAGGIVENELDNNFMLTKLPGVFCAGEMLDWDAPTGGYLLTGCFASGHAAAQGLLAWLNTTK